MHSSPCCETQVRRSLHLLTTLSRAQVCYKKKPEFRTQFKIPPTVVNLGTRDVARVSVLRPGRLGKSHARDFLNEWMLSEPWRVAFVVVTASHASRFGSLRFFFRWAQNKIFFFLLPRNTIGFTFYHPLQLIPGSQATMTRLCCKSEQQLNWTEEHQVSVHIHWPAVRCFINPQQSSLRSKQNLRKSLFEEIWHNSANITHKARRPTFT